MLQSFKSLTWNFDVSDVTHKCFLLTYTLDGNFLCQKYWNFVGNPVYFKVLCSLTWTFFMSYNMKLSFYMTWNFYVLGANRKVSCCITWNYMATQVLESSLLLNTIFFTSYNCINILFWFSLHAIQWCQFFRSNNKEIFETLFFMFKRKRNRKIQYIQKFHAKEYENI
jgi:hypothetical protein